MDLRDFDRVARDCLLVERADGLRLLGGEVAVARLRAPPRERLEPPERDVPRRRGVEGRDVGADRVDREMVVESAVRGAGRAHPAEDVPLGDGEGRVLAVVETLEVGGERGVRRHLDDLRLRLLRLEREPLVRHYGEALGLPVLLEERKRGAGVRDLLGGECEAEAVRAADSLVVVAHPRGAEVVAPADDALPLPAKGPELADEADAGNAGADIADLLDRGEGLLEGLHDATSFSMRSRSLWYWATQASASSAASSAPRHRMFLTLPMQAAAASYFL